ncbi:hypothetical protein ACROYT_G003446 [Oculina patagonica]
MKCMEKLTPNQSITPVVDVMLIDGTAPVNILKRLEHVTHSLAMHIKLTCRKSVTSYRVCSGLISSGKDAYQTRDKRGRGVRRRVEADVRLPDSWGESLKEESNKTELILYEPAQQGQGKSTVWATWMSFGDQATIAFMVLSKMPSVQDVLNAMPVLKGWVVLLYDQQARAKESMMPEIFLHRKEEPLRTSPLLLMHLYKHNKIVAYQAGHC